MKHKIKTITKKPKFEPIEIKITVESLEELKDLVLRLDFDSKVLINYAPKHSNHEYVRDSIKPKDRSAELFYQLFELYKSRRKS